MRAFNLSKSERNLINDFHLKVRGILKAKPTIKTEKNEIIKDYLEANVKLPSKFNRNRNKQK